jgi:UDP-N-acetylglucosamine 3-dehydrogenase
MNKSLTHHQTKHLKTAVIGVGNMGKSHARIFSQISRLTAIVDNNPTTGMAVADQYHVKWYKHTNDLLQQEQLDAVSIAVPTEYHSQIATHTLSHHLPTLIEKPITTDTKTAEELIHLAQKNNTYLLVGHVERFNPSVIKLKKIIEQGKLGNILNLLAIRVGIVPPPSPNSDVVLDLSVHDIDIFNYLIEEIPHHTSIIRTKILTQNTADIAAISLQYKKATGLIQTNWVTPIKMRKLYVTGTSGFVELDYIHQKISLYNKVLNFIPNGDFYDLISKYDSPKKEVYVSRKEPLYEELKYFLKHIRSTRPDNITHQAFDVLKIIQSTNHS